MNRAHHMRSLLVAGTVLLALWLAAAPAVVQKSNSIRANNLPLRIGLSSTGGNGFVGEMAWPLVFNRVLSAEEIKKLAAKERLASSGLPGCMVSLDYSSLHGNSLSNMANPKLPAQVVRDAVMLPHWGTVSAFESWTIKFKGKGCLEIPPAPELDGTGGLTLSAWICPAQLPEAGMRIFDKSPAGAATGYVLDTFPGDAVRLITREPHLTYAVKLQTGEWVHVAATVDGASGRQIIYINGKAVAQAD